MIVIAIVLIVILPLFLLASGSKSNKKTEDFYASYFTREELEQLGRDQFGKIIKK